jgi:hypothetical protein
MFTKPPLFPKNQQFFAEKQQVFHRPAKAGFIGNRLAGAFFVHFDGMADISSCNAAG